MREREREKNVCPFEVAKGQQQGRRRLHFHSFTPPPQTTNSPQLTSTPPSPSALASSSPPASSSTPATRTTSASC